jgi:ribosomal protein L7/L12
VDDAQLARRFGLIEQQLRALSEHLGVECPVFASDGSPAGAAAGPAVPAAVLELARAGKSTQAISEFRKLTGASLLEAKRVVDSL